MLLNSVAVDHGLPTDRLAAQTPDGMMESFESVGFGCEFGLVQRFCGAEPLGLFRFASLPYRHLLHLLQTKLAELDDPALLSVGLREGDEWWGLIEKFDIRYHTYKSPRMVSEAEALRGERQRIAFLKRKFLEQLEQPDKIFVRKEFSQTSKPMEVLLQELRLYAPHDLLWIRRTARTEEGNVEHVGPGLTAANISRIWDNAAPDIEGLAVWLRIIEQALHDLRPEQFARLRTEAQAHGKARLTSSEWIASDACTTDVDRALPSALSDTPVLRHTLEGNGPDQQGFVLRRHVSGFVPSRLYVASAHVWIPDDFQGSVEFRFPGSPMNWRWPASIKLRNCWQRLSSNIRFPDGETVHTPGIYAVGKPGSWFCSAGWRIEPGVVPGDLLPS